MGLAQKGCSFPRCCCRSTSRQTWCHQRAKQKRNVPMLSLEASNRPLSPADLRGPSRWAGGSALLKALNRKRRQIKLRLFAERQVGDQDPGVGAELEARGPVAG